jgi:hypothetical protein
MKEIDGGERRGKRPWWLVVPLAGVVLASACGSQPTSGESATSSQSPRAIEIPGSRSTATTSTEPSRRVGTLATLTFTDQGGSWAEVNVYSGPRAQDSDRHVTASYLGRPQGGKPISKEQVNCVTEGRSVRSKTEEGENAVPDEATWFRLDRPGLPQFATAIYGIVDPAAEQALPQCDMGKLDQELKRAGFLPN